MNSKKRQTIIKKNRRQAIAKLAISSSIFTVGMGISQLQTIHASEPTSLIAPKQQTPTGTDHTENNNIVDDQISDSKSTKFNEDDQPSENQDTANSSTDHSTLTNDTSSTIVDSNKKDETSSSIDQDSASNSSLNNNNTVNENESSSSETIVQENNSNESNEQESAQKDTIDDQSDSSNNAHNETKDEPQKKNAAMNSDISTKSASETPTDFKIGDSKYTHADAVDIASYQNWMTQADFNYLKSIGIKTVIIKLTEGTGYTNPYARSQIQMAQNAGLTVSVYHFVRFNTTNGGNNEAQYLSHTMNAMNLNKSTLIFADIEAPETLVGGGINMKNALQAFWNSLSRDGFNNHGVYVYEYYDYREQVVSTVGRSRTWLAQYPFVPTKGGSYEQRHKNEGYGAWQFASTAMLNGHRIDVSHSFNDLLLDHPLANIDGFDMRQDGIHVVGWHIPTNNSNKYSYIIAYDPTSHKEIGRVLYQPSNRSDVQKAYPGFGEDALKSGFDVTIPIRNDYKYSLSNRPIQFILRHSADSFGNSNYDEVWTKNYSFNNLGNIDSLNLNSNNILHVSGWHATDDAYRLGNNYIIVYDATSNREITRVKYTPQVRNDVAGSRYAGHILNSRLSGFNLNINLGTYLVNGKNIRIVMRNSDDSNLQSVDFWSPVYKIKNENKGVVDAFELKSNNVLHVYGWHAADASSALKHAKIIVYDASSHREITRADYTPLQRRDVANSSTARGIANSLNSGFEMDIDLKDYLINGKNIQVVLRYSSDTGKNDSQFVDVWSPVYKIKNENKGVVDAFELKSNNVLHVYGWHAADASSALKHAKIIVYDASSHREITRADYTPLQRRDVANSSTARGIANSLNSGFEMDIDLKDYLINGKNIQVVLRYSSDTGKNDSQFVDVWSPVYKIKNENKGVVDAFELKSNNVLHVYGWHAADASSALKHAKIIIYDATSHREVTRMSYSPSKRQDVASNRTVGNIANSLNSGFDLNLNLNNYDINNKQLQIVMRYSDSPTNTEPNFVDIWSKPVFLKKV
nr:hypothetical protein [Ligilactobacillus acidipiscis]